MPLQVKSPKSAEAKLSGLIALAVICWVASVKKSSPARVTAAWVELT